ncbi:hypothetical protein LCGC14_0316830 [marine sediment metagenome]|uniref:Uncharacterized protein n=1 Tax=marine sediment metagenome TaxID=412755 RepID=A0A0F9W7Z7_9ZZZZ
MKIIFIEVEQEYMSSISEVIASVARAIPNIFLALIPTGSGVKIVDSIDIDQ